MEHLTYDPSPETFRREVRAATDAPLEVLDWSLYDIKHGEFPQVTPAIPWFGHDHAKSSYYHLGGEPRPMSSVFYGYQGDEWNIEECLHTRKIEVAHLSFRGLPPVEVIKRTAAFIQSWLYFGLLEAILGRPVSTSFMVRSGHDGAESFYSRTFPAALETWTARLQQIEEDFRAATYQQALQCVIEANSVLGNILSDLSKNEDLAGFQELQKLIQSTEPAISALYEGIARLIEQHLSSEISSFNQPGPLFARPYADSLIQKGWCRFVIASAEIAMSPSLLRFVDVAGYNNTSTGHELCTADQCERNLIDVASYTQSHRPHERRCQYVKPDFAQLLDILNAGYIPVVQIDLISRQLTLGGVHPDDRKMGYIAFSHVWADGLGSCTEDGLPFCQVRRLHELAEQRIEHGAWFWIDSLCVPKQEPYRGKAIELMKYTYKCAEGVIVLDKGLQGLSTKSSDLEIGWCVFASGWFGRLWTYQEGFLPPWVDLELSDGLTDLYKVVHRLHDFSFNRKEGSLFPSVFARDLVAVLQKARPLDRKHYERPMARRMVDLFNAMTRRRSSRPDDQLLVMSLLLDFELRTLLRKRGADRWKTFYLGLRRIPWTILFDQRPKMEISPFRWAPSTWISSGKDQWLHYEDEMAEITKGGLKITLMVIRLHTPAPIASVPCVIQAEGVRYELHRVTSDENPQPVVLQTFNIIFVRYFKHQTPKDVLREHSSLLMRVGLGSMTRSTRSGKLEYDFNGGWEIHLRSEENIENPLATSTVLEGDWETRDFCFT